MAYKLVITKHTDELLDNIIRHLLYQLKNEQAVRHLLNGCVRRQPFYQKGRRI